MNEGKERKRQLSERVSQKQNKRTNECVDKRGRKKDTSEENSAVTSEGWRQGTSKQASRYVSERVTDGKNEEVGGRQQGKVQIIIPIVNDRNSLPKFVCWPGIISSHTPSDICQIISLVT